MTMGTRSGPSAAAHPSLCEVTRALPVSRRNDCGFSGSCCLERVDLWFERGLVDAI